MVQFTDIDYKVYSDAAEYIYRGQSPYKRAAYRYTPLLAWLLTPVVKWPDFGKFLFCAADVANGFLYFELAACSQTMRKDEDKSRMKKSVVVFWLANPLTAIISARGNADVLVCAVVLWTLYLLMRNQWWLAALVYGLLAVHLKLYPIIYLPSIYLSLSNVSLSSGWIDYGKRLISNMKGYIFVLIFCCSLLTLVIIFYMLYAECKIIHYFLHLILNPAVIKKLSMEFCRFHDDLPFCWLITTAVFVSFNKVCTSQYFIWYICLLPIAQRSIEISTVEAVYLIILWFLGQAFWLYPAYLFEFQGLNMDSLHVEIVRLKFGWAELFFVWLMFLVCNKSNLDHSHLNCADDDLLKYTEIYFISMLYLVGLGLGNVDDITVKGMVTVQKCSRVYLESYTSIMSFGLDKKKLEEFFNKEIEEADRMTIELDSDDIIDEAFDSDVCLLVVGDPLGATTHASLVFNARKAGVDVEIVHNASIISAVGCCGLQVGFRKFGEIVSIVFWEENWHPDSYYFKIAENKKRGLHTLCLLVVNEITTQKSSLISDIKTKEQSIKNMMKGRKEFLPPRYMTCSDAAKQLLEIVDQMSDENMEPGKLTKRNFQTLIYTKSTEVVALARVGWDDQKIVFCSLEALCDLDMGPPLHSLIIPGELHPMELDFLKTGLQICGSEYVFLLACETVASKLMYGNMHSVWR
ncbi:unnamed protein product [Brugia timori]|uniref:GPI alpha-1,4-mannosyltransferase I, catalytic subunit n=1 Tax=Brugia timori TaxID=42155 RepID=A0A0R3QTL5_9BILA|nr:unnamed protein product [Brugia timori]